MRDCVIEDARSSLVLMSTKPQAAFLNAQLAVPDADYCKRTPVKPHLFGVGMTIRKGFKAPAMGTCIEVAWHGLQRLNAERGR